MIGRVGFGRCCCTTIRRIAGRDVVNWKGGKERQSRRQLEGLEGMSDSTLIGRVGRDVGFGRLLVPIGRDVDWKGWKERRLEGLEGTLYLDVVVDCSDRCCCCCC